MFCAALNCFNYSKSKVSTFKFKANSKLRKQWLLKMKRKEFQPAKNSRICVRRFLGSDFKPLRLHLKEDAEPWTIFFLFQKEITGKNFFRSTVRSAFAKRRKLEVCILHLSYST